jgi:alanyl-tRNA synthetase
MTRLLYLEDPCLKSFRAKIEKVDGDWIELDRTAFYPGGGGQEPDTGWIDGFEVVEVKKDWTVLHRVPGHTFKEQQEVEATLNWERRLDLMRGHTAEHMLFSALYDRVEDIELIKISIGPEKKSFIVKGDLDWNVISLAQGAVNEAVVRSIDVDCSWVGRTDPLLQEIRIKMDRISGDEVRIVRIGDLDVAACSGIHVPNTGDIMRILVTKLTAAKPKGAVEIEFEVGEKAIDKAFGLATIALMSSDLVGSHAEDLLKAISNLKDENERVVNSLKRYGRQVLQSLDPEKVSGIDVYKGIYHGLDSKTVMIAANRFVRKERTFCVLVTVNDSLIMVVARSPDLTIDCRDLINEALEPIGGRGGGKPEFATGGASSTDGAEEAVERVLQIIGS